jgi:hypothetical protein
MKEVVRSGREVEWSSEKERGLTVRLRNVAAFSPAFTDPHRLLQIFYQSLSNG